MSSPKHPVQWSESDRAGVGDPRRPRAAWVGASLSWALTLGFGVVGWLVGYFWWPPAVEFCLTFPVRRCTPVFVADPDSGSRALRIQSWRSPLDWFRAELQRSDLGAELAKSLKGKEQSLREAAAKLVSSQLILRSHGQQFLWVRMPGGTVNLSLGQALIDWLHQRAKDERRALGNHLDQLMVEEQARERMQSLEQALLDTLKTIPEKSASGDVRSLSGLVGLRYGHYQEAWSEYRVARLNRRMGNYQVASEAPEFELLSPPVRKSGGERTGALVGVFLGLVFLGLRPRKVSGPQAGGP